MYVKCYYVVNTCYLSKHTEYYIRVRWFFDTKYVTGICFKILKRFNFLDFSFNL